MTTRTQQWITDLNTRILKMSSMVEESLRTAMAALAKQDAELAKRVREQDDFIDTLEDEIKDDAIKTLALQQPMGADLRFITSVLTIAHELERVGDRALNIANRVSRISEGGYFTPLEALSLAQLGEVAQKMLEQAINSFVYQDAHLAKTVASMDEQADEICEKIQVNLIELMQKEPQAVGAGLHSTIIALNLERVADQATNIAKQVIYIVDGLTVRHKWVEEMPGTHVTREPLDALERHAKIVNECLVLAREALSLYTSGHIDRFTKVSMQVSQKENEADAVKRNVRGHLPRGVIMPIDKFELFAFVKEQDQVADAAQTLVDWLSLMDKGVTPELGKGLHSLYDKCVEAAQLLPPLIREAKAFLKDGNESHRTKVKQLIRSIRSIEHEADAMEMSLKHLVFKSTTDAILVHHQITTVDIIGRIADHAENSADMMRAMVAK